MSPAGFFSSDGARAVGRIWKMNRMWRCACSIRGHDRCKRWVSASARREAGASSNDEDIVRELMQWLQNGLGAGVKDAIAHDDL